MLLSQAIREGAQMYPMCTGVFWKFRNNEISTCCALGGAALATNNMTNGHIAWNDMAGMYKRFPILRSIVDENENVDLASGIVRMNDSGIFTREEIADCVEEIEHELSPQVVTS